MSPEGRAEADSVDCGRWRVALAVGGGVGARRREVENPDAAVTQGGVDVIFHLQLYGGLGVVRSFGLHFSPQPRTLM